MVQGEIGAPAPDDRPVLLDALRRHWRVIVAAAVVGAVLGHQLSQLQPVRYTAEARIVLSKVVPFDALGSYTNPDPQRFVANQLSVITSEPVLEEAADELDDTTVRTLRASITASGAADEDVLMIAAEAPTARAAKERADAVALGYAAFRLRQVQTQTQGALRQTTSEQGREAIRAQAFTYGNGLSQFQEAVLPTSPSGPRPKRDGFVLGVVLALAAMAYALLRESRPQGSARLAAAAAAAGAPVLSALPAATRRRRAGDDPAEALKMLLVTLDYVSSGPSRRLLLTSDHEGGSTDTAVGLALAAADKGLSVVLVDGYGHTGELAQSAGFPLVAESDRPRLASVRPTHAAPTAGGPLVAVLPLTPEGPLHQGPAAQRLVGVLANDPADLVIIDAPPVATSAEGFALVAAADLVVLVLDERAAPSAIAAVKDRLAFAGATLTGVVLSAGGRRWRRGATHAHAELVAAESPRPVPATTSTSEPASRQVTPARRP